MAETQARLLDRPTLVVESLVQQTRAAAAGGDYQRALDARAKALTLGVGDRDAQAWLEAGKHLWTLGLHTVGFGALDLDKDLLLQKPHAVPWLKGKPDSRNPELWREILVLQAFVLFGQTLPAFQAGRGDESIESSLRLLKGKTFEPALCPTTSGSDGAASSYECGLVPILSARMKLGLGEVAEAISDLEIAHSKLETTFAGLSNRDRARLRGLYDMALGDAYAAPNSSPFELNLWLFGSALTSADLKLRETTQEFGPVPASHLLEAEGLYDRARSAFTEASCRRCEIDLTARGAYLDFGSGSFRRAAESFLEAAEAYWQLGDAFFYGLARIAASASSFLARGNSAEDPTEDRLASIVQRESAPWRTHATAARIFSRLAVQQGSRLQVPSALAAFDRAKGHAATVSATALRGEIAYEKAQLLMAIGRHTEAALVIDQDVRPGMRTARRAETGLAMQHLRTLAKRAGVMVSNPSSIPSLFREIELLSYLTNAALAQDQRWRLPSLERAWKEIEDEAREVLSREGIFGSSVEIDRFVLPWRGHILLAAGRFEEFAAYAQEHGSPRLLTLSRLAAWTESDLEADRLRVVEEIHRSTAQLLTQFEKTLSYEGWSWERLLHQQALQDLEFYIEVSTKAEDYEEAARLLEGAEDLWRRNGRGGSPLWQTADDSWRILANRGAIQAGFGWRAWQAGDRAAAKRFFDHANLLQIQSLERIAALGSGLGNLADRSSYQNDTILAHNDHARLLARRGVATGDPEVVTAGLGIFEASRAEIFHSMLEEVVGESGQDSPLRDWWRLRSEVEARQIEQARRVPARSGNAGANTDHFSGVEKRGLEERLRQMELDLAGDSNHGKSYEMRQQEFRSSIRAVQHWLMKNEQSTTLLVYFLHRAQSAVWVVDGQSVQFRELPRFRRSLDRSIFELANKLDGREEHWQDPARELYEALISPIEDLLPTTASDRRPRLGILPHQSLHYVPFATLVDQRSVRYLIDNYDVFYFPSLRFLETTVRDRKTEVLKTGQGLAAIFGYNGEHIWEAEVEAREVASALDTPAVYTGSSASGENLKRVLEGADILHLAAHTHFVEQNPFRVAIDLHDGDLKLYELAGQKIMARLVTLTGCETGLGEFYRSDEIIGFSRTFLAAGALQVIASLWRVDDETVLPLMRRLYSAIDDGASPLDALMLAQREARSRSLHPGYWAAFSLMGIEG